MSRWERDMRISTRWTPKLNCDSFVGVPPCRRWTICIMTLFLHFIRRNVWIQVGSDFENEAFLPVSFALFELWRPQTKTKPKMLERNKNNSFVASFWYRSELLTLNSLRERWVWSFGSCSHHEESDRVLQSNISSISCFQLATNEDRQLQMHLSRRLLRVRSSDRYQNEATELLFLFLSNVFVFVFVSGLQSSKSATVTDHNASFSKSDPA